MRYKIRQTETVEYVLDAPNEEDALEFTRTCTTRELRAIKKDITTIYEEATIEKTILPADFNYDDHIEEIHDDWPGYDCNNHGECTDVVFDGI